MFPINDEAGSHRRNTSQPIVHARVNSQGIVRFEGCLYGTQFVDKLSVEALIPGKYPQLSDSFKIQVAG
ncbi:MAG TPA: hypothetical protein DEG47_25485 [Cyanobacteria bacterium UBA11148]|nr:hypothetical protein [Cyanobacteria bacterium UBA11148]